MPVTLNHTIVPARDKWASARWLADLLELPEPFAMWEFVCVAVGPTTLDFVDDPEEFEPVHFSFLVTEDEFDRIFGRLTEQGVEHWADPGRREPGEIYRQWGGRGVYFMGPTGHSLELQTVPYGGWTEDDRRRTDA